MNKALQAAAAVVVLSGLPNLAPTAARMEDDPVLMKLQFNELEARNGDGDNPVTWDLDVWSGRDLHKLWIKSEGARAGGNTERAELQILYSRGTAPYWDFQIGWRRDWLPKPERNWLALGFAGLAPYFIETDAALFVGGSGRAAFRVNAGHELPLTQRLSLEPEIELNFHSRNDRRTGTGAGLSNIEIGLRLHYAVNRQLRPYIGVNWEQKVGNTADYARGESAGTGNVQWLIGMSGWL